MRKQKDIYPPKWAVRFIEWYCKPELVEDLLGDLNECFDKNHKRRGIRYAKFIYAIDAFKFIRLYTAKKPKFLTLIINAMMLSSYIKTTGRSMLRNKLFSTINIIGLAISMSVGLLIISFISDLKSYDQFHLKGDRIYRVNTKYKYLEENENTYASTSVKAGELIKENMAGAEKVTILTNGYNGFDGDVRYGEQIVPLEGFWADENFLQVFTFPLIEGDESTALKDPNSLVITQKAAKKLFGSIDPLGKTVSIHDRDFSITGVMKDIPKFSQMRFEMLGSFSTQEVIKKDDKYFMKWTSVWSNYVYVLLSEGEDPANFQTKLNNISEEENKSVEHVIIHLNLQPLYSVVISKVDSNAIGSTVSPRILWILGLLSVIVILSASFNYTNLSIARSMRRSREVGIRKVIGALRIHVIWQFISESVAFSLFALVLAIGIFLLIRPEFLAMAPDLSEMASLKLSPPLLIYFVTLAILVGIVSGILPAIFFSKINPVKVLKDVSSLKVFRNLNMRKILIGIQYTFSLIFITATIIGYYQYKGLLTLDLGYETKDILNIRLLGNKADLLKMELNEIPEVTQISQSSIITSVGNYWGSNMKYKDPNDSASVYYNNIDENYLPLHNHNLLAGRNFEAKVGDIEESEIIVNESVLKRFNIGGGDPQKALGKFVKMNGKPLAIIGVMKDFHYGQADRKLLPVAFRYSNNPGRYLNLKINSKDLMATMSKIEKAWKKIDKVHPMDAHFYDDQIENAYSEFSAMVKAIGFLSFLAISIASMGLFGMVVFTTETRQKEVGIRKALGADILDLIFLMSKTFLILLATAASIALPVTYLLFTKVILNNFAFHAPIRIIEVVLGFIIVGAIAFIMIGSQTFKVARTNPATVLKNE